LLKQARNSTRADYSPKEIEPQSLWRAIRRTLEHKDNKINLNIRDLVSKYSTLILAIYIKRESVGK